MLIILATQKTNQEDYGSRPAQARINETPSQPIKMAWWSMPVIAATQEA
jgi:hypothetical protein